MIRLNCEHLESRENPVGPVIVDPIGIPVTEAPPAVVAAAPAPAPATPADAAQAVIDRIIQETLRALAGGF